MSKILDVLYTADDREIYWIHDSYDVEGIDPDDLYVDEYAFLDEVEQLVASGEITRDNITNYTCFEEEIEEYFKEYGNE